MAEMGDLCFNIDVTESLKSLEVSQLTALLNECIHELERRVTTDER